MSASGRTLFARELREEKCALKNFLRETFSNLLSVCAALRLSECKGRMRSRRITTMARLTNNFAVTLLAALALVIPASARENGAKNSKSTVNATMNLVNPATIAGRQLKPGTYDVKADDSKVTLSRNGKVVAQAPVQWKGEMSKSKYSSIVTDGDANQVKEIHFNGKTRYVELSASSASNGQ
jgi:hypothetical protein